jgi:hypothetical protein
MASQVDIRESADAREGDIDHHRNFFGISPIAETPDHKKKFFLLFLVFTCFSLGLDLGLD